MEQKKLLIKFEVIYNHLTLDTIELFYFHRFISKSKRKQITEYSILVLNLSNA